MELRRSFFTALGFVLIFFSRGCSLSITVNNMECVSEAVHFEGDTVSGYFVVLDHDIFWGSDHPGIEFTKNLSSRPHKVEHTNFVSIILFLPQRPVSFYIHVGHIPNEYELAKDEHLHPVNVRITELREALFSVAAEQKYLKARDARHRATNESTRKRVVFYTLAEYILLAATSGLQVVYIRRLFSKSVAYNRV
ncbi:hypothetical protein PVL29_008349 [Vitis rotundifolia]|uniref:GOLD domain-containing protein n=1 Tax=Vitis rotundifolia TaxID=103349 RepID=A0AA38ZVK6_VITRO|nr:hypothetical protein PVL29_008349 [Vitis rotundifolia]